MTNLTKQEQSGRSMVEMLGVLAVIGVLSITGISGYTTAMNKHRANEIADGATKRAMAIASQIQLGNTDLTLGEFGDSTANTIQGVEINTPTKVGENQFKLQLNWTDTSQKTTLCKELKNVVSTTGTGSASQIDENCTRIIFNNDMSLGATSSNNTNKGTNGCLNNTYGSDCENTCPSGTDWSSGTTSSYTGTTVTGTTCKCEANKKWDSTNKKCILSCAQGDSCGCPDGQAWTGTECSTDCYEAGTCTDGDMTCSMGYSTTSPCCLYGGTYPNCVARPQCVKDNTCNPDLDICLGYENRDSIYSNGCCLYGGTYPNNCNPIPDCVTNNTCEYDHDQCTGTGCPTTDD